MTVGDAELAAMRQAIGLTGETRPHPNPRVGAVVLDPAGAVVAQGTHRGPGHPHAERVALAALSAPLPAGSTIITTLEPCNHHGLTPPCTEAIVEAGIRRVIVGAGDPDPKVAGSGIEELRRHGVEVTVGVLEEEVIASDPAYFHHRRTGRPLMTLKSAVTIDGQSAALDGTSQWITGDPARRDAHLLRSESDAVVVGAGTLRTDDPSLTVRLDDFSGPQPVAVVVQGRRPLPESAQLWKRSDTLVVSTGYSGLDVEHLVVPAGPDGRPEPAATVHALGERGLLSVLVEGGATLARALWDSRLIDQGVTYLGAQVAGGSGLAMFSGHWETIGDVTTATVTDVRRVGSDVRLEWAPVRE